MKRLFGHCTGICAVTFLSHCNEKYPVGGIIYRHTFTAKKHLFAQIKKRMDATIGRKK